MTDQQQPMTPERLAEIEARSLHAFLQYVDKLAEKPEGMGFGEDPETAAELWDKMTNRDKRLMNIVAEALERHHYLRGDRVRELEAENAALKAKLKLLEEREAHQDRYARAMIRANREEY